MLSAAKVLKMSANLAMTVSLAKLLADDLAAEVSRDVGTFTDRTRLWVNRSPYAAAGAATAVGVLAGILLVKSNRLLVKSNRLPVKRNGRIPLRPDRYRT